MSTILRWLISKQARRAADLRHRVLKLVNAQRDLLTAPGIEAIHKSAAALRAAVNSGESSADLQNRIKDLENTANKWLKPYPHPGVRDNVDVILVALVVALGIRTFFLQPMAIPTGSMQPTLYGITAENLKVTQPDFKIPGLLTRIGRFIAFGERYYHVVARAPGQFNSIERPQTLLPFVRRQKFQVGDAWYSLWMPPTVLPELRVEAHKLLFAHAGVDANHTYKPGEDILKLKVVSGDRLFVDRFTYHFRRPKRGEIVIFASTGIPMLTQHTHYIKRLIGLPGETIRIGNDRHAVVNAQRLDASTPGFENLYSFNGPPETDHYSGHVNNLVGEQVGKPDRAPRFPDEQAEYHVGPKRYFVMGDNTMNSYDSRYWGDFPQEKVIGKCGFVFWPISARFGWGFR